MKKWFLFFVSPESPQARRAGANSKVNIYVSAVARHVWGHALSIIKHAKIKIKITRKEHPPLHLLSHRFCARANQLRNWCSAFQKSLQVRARRLRSPSTSQDW